MNQLFPTLNMCYWPMYALFIKLKCTRNIHWLTPCKLISMDTVSKTVKHIFYEKDIAMTNIVVCTTDGAASMVGHYQGLIAFLKREVPNIRPLTASSVLNI